MTTTSDSSQEPDTEALETWEAMIRRREDRRLDGHDLCPRCHGFGLVAPGVEDCPDCGGDQCADDCEVCQGERERWEEEKRTRAAWEAYQNRLELEADDPY